MKSLIVAIIVLLIIQSWVLSQNLNDLVSRPDDSLNLPDAFSVDSTYRAACQSNSFQNFTSTPNELDWRYAGRVSPIQYQKKCNTCWAYATAALLEGQMGRCNLTKLSEQYLIDCMRAKCKDRNWVEIIIRLVSVVGIMEQEHYNPVSKPAECHSFSDKIKLKVVNFTQIISMSEQDLKNLIADYGPVLVGIERKNFYSGFRPYKGGVYKCVKSRADRFMEHYVVIVGYGTDPEKGDYWIIKNSFGKNWGEDGYMRMARKDSSYCGVTRYVTTANIQLLK